MIHNWLIGFHRDLTSKLTLLSSITYSLGLAIVNLASLGAAPLFGGEFTNQVTSKIQEKLGMKEQHF